jgi:hypothetical protein
METLTKIYNFAADEEGWTKSPGNVRKPRTAIDQWVAYPIGTNPEFITEHPSGWKYMEGATIPVTGAEQASNRRVSFTLRTLLPATSYDYSNPDNLKNLWIRLKQDRVEITVTYFPVGTVFGTIRGGTIKFGTLK